MARKTDGKKAESKQKQKGSAPQRRRSPEEAPTPQDGAILDASTKRDIVGVIFLVLAVVFMLLVALPADAAVVSVFTSQWLHLIFGIGCYILPFVFACIGMTFLLRFKSERVPARAALGLTILFIALLGFIALFAPISNLSLDNPALLFSEPALVGYGGYIGSSLAWVGVTLFGRIITGVILAGIMVIGLLIVGFSISKLIDMLRKKKSEYAERFVRESSPLSSSAAFARVRKGREQPYALQDVAMLEQMNPAGDNTRPLMASPHAVHPNMVQPELQQLPQFVPLAPAIDPIEPESLSGRHSRRNPRVDALSVAAEMSASGATESITRPLSRLPVIDVADEEPSKSDESSLGEDAPQAPEKGKGSPRKARKASKDKKSSERVQVSLSTPRPQDGFMLPDMSLLKSQSTKSKGSTAQAELSATASRLQETLEDFGIDAEVKGWIAGPTVTLFKIELPSGVRVNRVTALNDDIALALAAPGVRIFAPIPGTNYVGIEVPNASRQTVLLSEVLADAPEGPLQIAIGKDVEGNSIVSDLAKMPHLLIGGTTGSGKSVAINAMIMSILMRATPSEVRFIMIDPKRVEFTPYNGIPHLYVPVVTEPKEAASALAWGVAEMERRLKVFSELGARNIGQYNAKVQAHQQERAAEADDVEAEGFDYEEMPYIVIIIDELADLMMNIGKEVEISISRIAQLARAAGIHLIVATQRPSTNVVTGLIKANITNRIAFNVASGIDSRVILDTPGAESLIGLGDLLLSKPELAKPQRIQGCFISEDEIAQVVDFIKEQKTPEYHSEILKTNVVTIGASDPTGGATESDDPLLWEAADIVVSSNLGSTSNIQRRLKVGYARAGRIMDQLEEKGIVGSANGSKPREVLVDEIELETIKAFEQNDEA